MPHSWLGRVSAILAALFPFVAIGSLWADTAPPQVEIPARILPVDRGFINQLMADEPVLQPIYDAGFRFHFDVAGSESLGFDGQHDGSVLQGRLFDYLNNRPNLDQLDLKLYRPVNIYDDKWNIGGMLDVGYGRDFSFVHSNGILDLHTYKSFTDPNLQFAVNQANVQIGAPHLKLTVGEWANPFGLETIDPMDGRYSVLSRGFAYTYGLPKTLTGAELAFSPWDHGEFYGGVTRGWDQGLNDDNSSIDGILGYKQRIANGLHWSIGGTYGPEFAEDNVDGRGMVDSTLCYDPCDCPFCCALDFLYWHEWHEADSVSFAQEPFHSNVVGAGFYSQYRVIPNLAIVDRLEWYHDSSGYSLNVPDQPGQTYVPPQRMMDFVEPGRSYEMYDLSVGFKVDLFRGGKLPRIELVPEYRLDYSDRKVFGQSNGSSSGGSNYVQQTLDLSILARF
ncbi:MAG: outer membrane beta-barrel protein [Tepidisphaeraceae bacterium]|jgi:putative OmpL-like beta-barrel porin-2